MKKLTLTLGTLISLSAATTALSYGGYGPGQGGYGPGQYAGNQGMRLDADCVKQGKDTFVLKFYNTPVTSYRQPATIMLKKLLNENCRIDRIDLTSVESVTVKAKAYAQTDISLLANGQISRSKTMSAGGRYGDANNEVTFFTKRDQSVGALQLKVVGDIDLKKIIIDTAESQGGYRPGRPGQGNGNGGYGRPNYGAEIITCSSKDKQYDECRVRGAKDVVLLNQLSDSSCWRGYSYGVIPNQGIWVNKGCRAKFKVLK